MNKLIPILFILIGFLCSNNCTENDTKWTWINSLPKPWLITESEVSNILPEFHKRFPKFEERLKAITLWKIGTPYEVFKLGEEKLPDDDPLIRLDVSDCTVHVLTSLSFAQSKTWKEARDNIMEIHYKNNIGDNFSPTFKSRWHFTSDRILSNPYTIDITNQIISSSELEKVDLTLNIKRNGTELLALGWSKNVGIAYIPNNKIDSELLNKLPPICGIAFVQKSYFKDGLAIAHEGILIDRKDLIHASSEAGETVKIDFLEYYYSVGKARFDGIMIYKFVPISK